MNYLSKDNGNLNIKLIIFYSNYHSIVMSESDNLLGKDKICSCGHKKHYLFCLCLSDCKTCAICKNDCHYGSTAEYKVTKYRIRQHTVKKEKEVVDYYEDKLVTESRRRITGYETVSVQKLVEVPCTETKYVTKYRQESYTENAGSYYYSGNSSAPHTITKWRNVPYQEMVFVPSTKTEYRTVSERVPIHEDYTVEVTKSVPVMKKVLVDVTEDYKEPYEETVECYGCFCKGKKKRCDCNNNNQYLRFLLTFLISLGSIALPDYYMFDDRETSIIFAYCLGVVMLIGLQCINFGLEMRGLKYTNPIVYLVYIYGSQFVGSLYFYMEVSKFYGTIYSLLLGYLMMSGGVLVLILVAAVSMCVFQTIHEWIDRCL